MSETVLVTGASSGIGAELSRLFAADGSSLILLARREAKLNALADDLRARHGVDVRVLARDLTEPGGTQAIFEELTRGGATIDVLVNNAGFGARGPAAALDTQMQLDMLELNIVALTHLARLFFPGMLARHSGGIINVGSLAGFQAGPLMAVYYATKAYVLTFSEALAEEARGSGVTITCLAPGPTETEFQRVASMEGSLLFKLGAMDARSVASAGHSGFRRGKVLVVPGARNKLVALMGRVTPRPVMRRLVRLLNEVRSPSGPAGGTPA